MMARGGSNGSGGSCRASSTMGLLCSAPALQGASDFSFRVDFCFLKHRLPFSKLKNSAQGPDHALPVWLGTQAVLQETWGVPILPGEQPLRLHRPPRRVGRVRVVRAQRGGSRQRRRWGGRGRSVQPRQADHAQRISVGLQQPLQMLLLQEGVFFFFRLPFDVSLSSTSFFSRYPRI